MEFKFPENFFWGSATAAHQVEGGNHNDWSEWEKKNAERLANKAESNFGDLPVWPEIKSNAQNPQNYISGRACDHYNRFREDFDIAQSLNQNIHRFSVEWSRIEPEEGRFDEKEVEHYHGIIEALRERNIEPLITIWHWTLPLWLRDKGGVRCKKFSWLFSRYAEKLISEFKDDVKYWITINEPEIYALNSYFRGRWPPQKRGFLSFHRAMSSLIKAHRETYDSVKKKYPEVFLGAVCNLSDFKASGGPINAFLKILAERFWNHYFLQRIRGEMDFIGLNFYFHNRINYGLNKNRKEIISDIGWDIHPEGIESVLRDLKQYNKPIFITESGIADAHDKNRAWFIKETVNAIHRALDNGVDIRGYFHWSLIDNFEWDKGFWPRFGLVKVNYETLERKIRPSAFEYAKICRENKISTEAN